MNKNEELVSRSEMSAWRREGIISAEEVAYRSGDLLVAENVVNGDRRIISDVNIRESNSNKRVLKG